MKITSQAQHAMFTKAASDPTYAASRGITADLAKQHLAAHEASGSPKLPERAEAAPAKPSARAKTLKIFGAGL